MTAFAFHPEALLDLDEIWEFIAADSIDAADMVVADILSALDSVLSFPHQGHRRRDLTSLPLRFLRVHDFLIAYADGEETLWVVAVIHGRRNPRVMATILRERK
jgi:toxin ParE1/3/4